MKSQGQEMKSQIEAIYLPAVALQFIPKLRSSAILHHLGYATPSVIRHQPFLVVVEDQRAYLDRLSRILVLLSGIREGSVRNAAGDAVVPAVVALDQRHLIGCLTVLEVPLVLRVGLDGESFACAVGVDQGSRE